MPYLYSRSGCCRRFGPEGTEPGPVLEAAPGTGTASAGMLAN